MKDTHQRFLVSVAVFATAMSTGLSDGLIGPTLPSLAQLASSTVSEMSTIYTWRACFAIAGSLLIGHLLDKVDPSWVLAAALFFQAVFASIAPWLKHIVAISAVSGLSAFFNGGINAGTYSLLFRLHGRKANSYIQTVRMCYIGGLALAPVVAKPFIINNKDTEDNLNETVTVPSDIQPSTITPISWTEDVDPFKTNIVQFAYIVVAMVVMIWSIMFCIFGCWGRLKSLCSQGSTTKMNDFEKSEVVLVVITLIMTLVYGGMDVGFGGLLFTYVTDYLSWSNGQGVLITTVFQNVKIVVVAVTIIAAMFLHPKWLVGVDVILLVSASTVMMALVGSDQNVAVWVCTVLLGIGLGNLHASNMSWLGKRVMISGKVSALFNVAFSGGIMAIPPLTGLAVERIGVKGVPIVIISCSIVCVITFLLLICVNIKYSPPKRTTTERQTSSTPIVEKGTVEDPVSF